MFWEKRRILLRQLVGIDQIFRFLNLHTIVTTGETVLRKGTAGAVLMVMVLLSLGLSGCHLRPLLYDVSVSPDAISPNADGADDATNIEYELSRNATVSIYFENAAGERFYFRQDRPRSAGEYRVQWGGTINQPYWLENEFGRQLVRTGCCPMGPIPGSLRL